MLTKKKAKYRRSKGRELRGTRRGMVAVLQEVLALKYVSQPGCFVDRSFVGGENATPPSSVPVYTRCIAYIY